MNFVSRFLKGNWLGKAKLYAFNPLKLKNLLQKLGSLMSRQGLLKEQLDIRAWNAYEHIADIFVKEILTGKVIGE